jgi:cell division protein FtsQ
VKSGDPLDSCSGVKNQSETTSRPLIWEDDAPAGSRFRRMQQAVPRTGRALPGMPLEMEDPDDDDLPRAKWDKKGEGSGRWWWPTKTFGRVLVGLGALIVFAALITAADIFKTYLQRDGRFRIAGASHIQSVGLTEVTRAQLLPVFGEDIGRNVFFVPLNLRRKELEAIPWIQQATVMRLLPDQIRVSVVERKPVAFTRHGQQIGLVDANGVLLDMAPAAMAAHHYSFPVLTGIDPGDRPASRQARMAVYQRMMSELDSNGKRNSEQLSEIDLTDPEDARVLMPEQGTDILVHFGEDHFLDRFQRYKDHIAEWRQQYPNLAAVDLRYEHQVVLQMASGASHMQANPEDPSAKASSDVKPADAAVSPAKPRPTGETVSNNKTGHEKSAHEKSKVRASEKTSSKRSAKAKSSASKSKSAISKSAKKNAAKKHPTNKTAAQNKVTVPGTTPAPSKTAAQKTTQPNQLFAARPMAAEGQ